MRQSSITISRCCKHRSTIRRTVSRKWSWNSRFRRRIWRSRLLNVGRGIQFGVREGRAGVVILSARLRLVRGSCEWDVWVGWKEFGLFRLGVWGRGHTWFGFGGSVFFFNDAKYHWHSKLSVLHLGWVIATESLLQPFIDSKHEATIACD